MCLAGWKLSVDFLGHDNHLAGNLFLGVVIAGKLTLNVAMGAFHTQSSAVFSHRLANIDTSLENF